MYGGAADTLQRKDIAECHIPKKPSCNRRHLLEKCPQSTNIAMA